MFRVPFWLQLLLLVLILKQPDAAAYHSGELREETDRSEEDRTNTTELKHNNGEQADNCCACQSLLEAARSGEVNIVKNLLICCKDNCTDRDKFRSTPLIYAAEFGNVEVVRVLLEGGVNVETSNARRWTALHAAARKENLDMCRLLLDWGATVDPLNDWKGTPLHEAARGGYLSVAKLLLDRGAEVRLKNDKGWTPLLFASVGGYLSMVKLLVEKGADINVKNGEGWTPLHGAARAGHFSVVKLLVERGADISAKTEFDITPLHFAAINGYLSMVKLLVERGADVRQKDKDGLTARDLAWMQGKEDVAEWLDSAKESMSHDVYTEASKGTANDCLTTSVPSENQTAMLECGQQQGVQTATDDLTEKLDLVSREQDRDCGPEEDACRSLLEAARSGGVDRAKGLAKCYSSDNCTDGSFFPDTDGLHQVHVDNASNNSRLRGRLAEVKVSRNSTVTKAPAVMLNDYEQIEKESEDHIPKEFEEQTANKFVDKIAKEFQDQTARDDAWKKLLEDQTASDDVKRKVLENQTASDDVRRKVLEDQNVSDVWRKVLDDQTASDLWRKVLEDKTAGYDGRRKGFGEQSKSDDVKKKVLEDQAASDVRRKVLEDQTASDVWRKVLEDVKKVKTNENLPKILEGNKNLASILH